MVFVGGFFLLSFTFKMRVGLSFVNGVGFAFVVVCVVCVQSCFFTLLLGEVREMGCWRTAFPFFFLCLVGGGVIWRIWRLLFLAFVLLSFACRVNLRFFAFEKLWLSW